MTLNIKAQEARDLAQALAHETGETMTRAGIARSAHRARRAAIRRARPAQVIIDSSAIVAILFNEHDAAVCANAGGTAQSCRISAANDVEAAVAVESQASAAAARQFDTALAKAAREPLLFKGDDFSRTDIEAAI